MRTLAGGLEDRQEVGGRGTYQGEGQGRGTQTWLTLSAFPVLAE